MTDEHVWVTIGGKPLYVGQVPKPKEKPPKNACLDALKAKRKRRQNPAPAPVEIFEEYIEAAKANPVARGVRDGD